MNFLVALVLAVLIALGQAPPAAQAADQPVHPCLIATTSFTVCKGTAGVLMGFINNNLAAQTATVTCWAFATGLAAGSVPPGFSSTGLLQVANIGPLGASQVIDFPGAGRAFPLGLVCQASGAVATSGSGTGIEVYVY